MADESRRAGRTTLWDLDTGSGTPHGELLQRQAVNGLLRGRRRRPDHSIRRDTKP